MNNIIFMGTPEFAVPSLEILASKKYNILCISQPDKPKGRKRKLQATPIKEKALKLNIPVYQPDDCNDEEALQIVHKFNPDIIITVAYGGFLGKKLRQIPPYGCINLHPSLLPKYRGAAPINYALFNNESITGCTIFKLTAKMDAGPIIYQTTTKIKDNECSTELSSRLAVQGAENILHVVKLYESNQINPQKQQHDQATYCKKIEKNDTWINWDWNAQKILNYVRGLALKPGMIGSFRDQRIKLIAVKKLDAKSDKKAGEVLEISKKGIVVSTIDYDLEIQKVQPAGKKVMDAFAFHLGARIQRGEQFKNGF